MKRAIGYAVAIAGLLAGSASLTADHGPRRVSAHLRGTNEVPVVSTPASGRFTAVIDDDAETVDFKLTFQDLQAPVTQAHIHFAQPNVNGGIMVWFCGSANNPGPAGTPACPQSGTVEGTFRPANVLAVTPQGIAAGEFAEFVRALRSGLAYANVHTQQSGGGEIRGQIKPGGGDHDDDDDHGRGR